MASATTPRPIVVIGSIGMDLAVRTPRMPAPGETITGTDFLTVPGGKGNNQAVAAAKLGADVHFVGRVGDDAFGQTLVTSLEQHNVHTDHVTVTEGAPSGIAMIMVDKHGENSIVIAPGAYGMLTPADVDAAEKLIASASVVLLQLEIPVATVKHAIAVCQRLGVPTILDPAPVPPKGMPRALFGVDVLTPNQTEAELLVGIEPSPRIRKKRFSDPKQIAMDLLGRGPKSVILKLGERGCMLLDEDGAFAQVKGFKVKVADTTAAGDAYNGALAVARAEGMPMREALRFANAAGALCCTTFGAQPSMPSREAVEKLLRSR
jgi:ribokinase